MRKKMIAVAALASLAAVAVSTEASARGGFGFHGGAAGFHGGGFHGGFHGGWHGGWGHHHGVWPGAAVVGVVGSYYDPYAYQGYDAAYYGGYGACYPNTIWAPPYGWIVQSSCGGW